ncbi:MAG TPA: sulfite exporter TauE/SafE family protein [Bryobacteraceae bacterium]|nr:sulfite exporter TauE/SafE family protein [Bryobacteraceae bacterium]
MLGRDVAAVEVAGVLFLASAIRSALGFGEALVAVPVLALVVPIQVAAPVAVLASITIALIAVLQDWRHIHVRSAVWLVLSTLAGIPLGLLLLKAAPEAAVKAILAAVIIAFPAYSLSGRQRPELGNERYSWLFGFLAGILGGAYGMNGPPLAVYGSLRGWTPKQFRATLQGYFLPASLIGICGYGLAGLWTPRVNHLYLVSLPLILAATFLGRSMNRRFDPGRFQAVVHVALIAIGLILLTQAVAA